MEGIPNLEGHIEKKEQDVIQVTEEDRQQSMAQLTLPVETIQEPLDGQELLSKMEEEEIPKEIEGTAEEEKLREDDEQKSEEQEETVKTAEEKVKEDDKQETAEQEESELTSEKEEELRKEALVSRKERWRKNGDIRWPQDNGFAGEKVKISLEVGTRIDRYGFPSGHYASPEGTPYTERSLFPGTDLEHFYYVYEVKKPVMVQSGNSAPWFDEEGGGIQYLFEESFEVLIAHGVLECVLKRAPSASTSN